MGTFGSLNFNLTGTYLDELITVPGPGVDAYDCAGLYSGSCGVPSPEWRHHARLGWQTPWSVDLSLTWRYFDSVEEFRGNPVQIDYELDAVELLRLGRQLGGHGEGVDPGRCQQRAGHGSGRSRSAVGTTGNGNTFPQTYDALGRWIFIRAQVGF